MSGQVLLRFKKSMFARIAAAVLIAVSALVPAAMGASEDSTGKRIPPDGAERIAGLEWKSDDVPIKTTPYGYGFKGVAHVEGNFNRAEWTLLAGSSRVGVDGQGNFELKIPITDRATSEELVAIGPQGEIEKETVGVLFSEWGTFKKEIKSKPPKNKFLVPGLGFSYIHYTQTRMPDYSMTALTLKTAYDKLILPPVWDFAASFFLTLTPLTKSDPSITARFLGVNLRFGYVVPQVKEPWRVSILGGIYYTTTFVTGERFGFRNMAGPQLFPNIRRLLRNGDSVSGYFKFSPVASALSLLSLSNREMAAGGSYIVALPDGRFLSYTLDLTVIQLALKSSQVDSKSVTVGMAYGL